MRGKQYEMRASGLVVPAKRMERPEFDRILKDEGIRSWRLRDAFWRDAQRMQPLTEEAVRTAVKKAVAKEPDIRWRSF